MWRTVLALVFGSGAQAASNAGAALLATVFLPPAERGAMVIALAIASLTSILCGLGTGFSFRLLLPRYQKSKMLLTAYSAFTIPACCFAATMSIAALLFFDVDGLALAAGCGLYSAVLLINMQLTEARFAFGKLKAGAYWATANAAGGFIGCVIGLSLGQFGSQLLLFQAAGCVTVSVVNLISMVRYRMVVFGPFRRSEVQDLIGVGFSPLIWGLGIIVISKADRLVLGQYQPKDVVAAYALAVTIAEMIRLFPTAFSQLITRELSASRSMTRPALMIFASACSALVLGAIAIPSTGFIVRRFLDPVYQLTVDLLVILVIGELFMALYIPCARALQGLGLSGITARLGLVAMVVIIPTYFWVSPRHGEHGVALVLASGYASLGLISLGFLVYGVKARWFKHPGLA